MTTSTSISDDADLVLQGAQRVAIRSGHDFIGVEHLLVALLEAELDLVQRVLDSLHVERRRLLADALSIVVPELATPAPGRLPMLGAAQRALEHASSEAFAFGDERVGAEHLLLGIACETGAPAAEVLARHGATLPALSERLERLSGRPRLQPLPASALISARYDTGNADASDGDAFTHRAQFALEAARRSAARLNHEHLGGEHVLLGLIADPDSVASQVLVACGFKLAALTAEIENLYPPTPAAVEIAFVSYTSGAKRVLEFAIEEVEFLKHSRLGTEHLLLALVRDQRGAAMSVLGARGIELDRLRIEVAKAIASRGEDDDPRRGPLPK